MEQQPKVFISYSWTYKEHKLCVKEWADRLIDDGIAVTIDIYDLKEGHDIPFFMEKMVADEELGVTQKQIITSQKSPYFCLI